MKIILNLEQRKFICEKSGNSKEFTFDGILESNEWIQSKQIRLVHNVINEHGNPLEDLLNRDVFLEMLKRGDGEWVKQQKEYDLNIAIHKLYGLLLGKTEDEVKLEVDNLHKQSNVLYSGIKDWNHERSTKINILEDELAKAQSENEKSKLTKKIEKLRSEPKPYRVPVELKKMYYAARDESKQNIKFSNVNQDVVKEAYGEDFKIL